MPYRVIDVFKRIMVYVLYIHQIIIEENSLTLRLF